MKFSVAIDDFIADMRAQGRINSDRTVVTYRHTLVAHGEDIGNRDPRTVGREDVKRTLRRWPKPNTQGTRRAVLVSFYDWAMEEGIRKDNPARQTRRPKRRPTDVYRLTRSEAVAMLNAARPGREQRVIYLGVCAGIRNAELRGLQGRHFQRPGFIHVSKEIAKGGRERWVPVIGDLVPVVADIRENCDVLDYVICAQRFRDPGINREKTDYRQRPASAQAVWRLVGTVATRAGIGAHIHPHLLRHAFGDHIARFAGLKNAQALMGHATVDTTADTYVGKPTLDELAAAVAGFSFATGSYPPDGTPRTPAEAPTGIEPVNGADRLPIEGSDGEEPHIDPAVEELLAPLATSVALYREVLA